MALLDLLHHMEQHPDLGDPMCIRLPPVSASVEVQVRPNDFQAWRASATLIGADRLSVSAAGNRHADTDLVINGTSITLSCVDDTGMNELVFSLLVGYGYRPTVRAV